MIISNTLASFKEKERERVIGIRINTQYVACL